jgi:FkbM family methyltransferase
MMDMLYRWASAWARVLLGKRIVSKPMRGTRKRLYYEQAQHLLFLLHREIRYESDVQGKLNPYIREGDLVFDVGANIGQYALVFSEWAGDSGRVIAFEPDPRCFAFLQFNQAMNQCRNLICRNSGIGDKNGDGIFFPDAETGGRKGSFVAESPGPGSTVAALGSTLQTLDAVIREFGEPAFIKMDIEGFEAAAVRGLTRDLPGTAFLIEVREETKRPVFDHFQARGFECLLMDGPREVIVGAAGEIPGFANLLFRKTPGAWKGGGSGPS